MRVASIRSLVLASVASLAMATSSHAVTILQFGQVDPEVDFVAAVSNNGGTRLTTNTGGEEGPIPVYITNLGGTVLGTPILAFEIFENVVSTGSAEEVGVEIQQTFSGTIRFVAAEGEAAGTNLLVATFEDAIFSGAGGSGSLKASQPPQTVQFTSDDEDIQDILDANPSHNFSISFSDITPQLVASEVGSTVRFDSAENSGTFAASPAGEVIPEPSGIVMAGTAMLVSLGCFGWRRRQASRA